MNDIEMNTIVNYIKTKTGDLSTNETRSQFGYRHLNAHNSNIDLRQRHQDKEVLSEAATDIVASIAHALRHAGMDKNTIGDILDRGYQHFVNETSPPQPQDTQAPPPPPMPPPKNLSAKATIEITLAQAVAFTAVHRKIGGDPGDAPRGQLDSLRESMAKALRMPDARLVNMANELCLIERNSDMYIEPSPKWHGAKP